MGLLSLNTDVAGQIGLTPRRVKMVTTDNSATISAAGYLNAQNLEGRAIYPTDVFDIIYSYNSATNTGTYGEFLPTFSSGVITLTANVNEGNVTLPVVDGDFAVFDGTAGVIKDAGYLPSDAAKTAVVMASAAVIANHIACFSDTAGTVNDDAATAINGGNIQAGLSGTAGTLASFPAAASKGSLKIVGVANTNDDNVTISNALHGQASVYSIPDGGQATAEFIISDSAGTQHITSGGLQVDGGSLLAGLAAGGTAGSVTLFPATTANGNFRMLAVNAGADFDTTISNAASVGQDQVITIPDSGAATANFLLDTGTANIITKQEFVGLSNVLTFGTGTWTVTRIAQGNYVSRHTPGDETSIIAIDITPAIVVAASKGFRLNSFDVIYAIAANPLDAHSVVLDRIVYADNVAVSVTSVPITVTLATATQANPYVTNAVVDTPAFLVTADSKYVVELTVNNAAASEYDYYGLMLRFSQTIA